MLELPRDFTLYGFTFSPELLKADMNEIRKGLIDKGISLKDVIFSAWIDDESDCTWLIAASKYLDDNEIKNIIDFIIENNVEKEYCLVDFRSLTY